MRERQRHTERETDGSIGEEVRRKRLNERRVFVACVSIGSSNEDSVESTLNSLDGQAFCTSHSAAKIEGEAGNWHRA